MQLISLAKNPVPGGAVIGELKAFDGIALRFARWGATRGPRRGTIVLFGGRGEFIEKYFEVITDLRRRGFAVATMDWRGQGGSERLTRDPRRGHVRSFADYEADLKQFMKEIVLPDCPPPYIALAHSMGANVMIRNAGRPGSWFDRMILSAPMITLSDKRVRQPAWFVRAATGAGALLGLSKSYVPGGDGDAEEQKDFENNPLTSDRERWARNKAVLDAAPELGLGAPTLGWLRAAYQSMDLIAEPTYPGKVEVPMMIIAAGQDAIVSARAVEDFTVALKVGARVLLPGARHEILQERDAIRAGFWAAFDAYLGLDTPRMSEMA